MAIYLKNSWNVPPVHWGSFADIQYAIQKNCEEIYREDYKNIVLSIPLFWGNPIWDYSQELNPCDKSTSLKYKSNELIFNGSDTFVGCGNDSSLNLIGSTPISIITQITPYSTKTNFIAAKSADGSHSESQRQWYLRLQNDGKIGFVWMGTLSASSYRGTVGTTVVSEGTHRLVSIYDPSLGINDRVSFFLDGIQESTSINLSAGTPSAIQSGTAHLGIGASLGSDGTIGANAYFFDGLISYSTILKSVLSANKAKLFNALPYGLYQKVSRPFYLFSTSVGWTGEIITRTNPSEILGRATSGISEVNGI